MSNYALVENDNIVGVYNDLPLNWKNVSNFYLLKDEDEYLKTLGWYKIVKSTPEYNPATHTLENTSHRFENNNVYEIHNIVAINVPPIMHADGTPFGFTDEELEQRRLEGIAIRWSIVRQERDQLMKDFDWRYQRYERQVRLNLPTIDVLTDLDAYMQALADITNQEDPFNITWPTYIEPNAAES